MKKRSNSKPLNEWSSIYELAALLNIESLLTNVDRAKKPYAAESIKAVRKRFEFVRATERNYLRLQVASHIVPILGELYEHVRRGSLGSSEVVRYLDQVIFIDQPEIGSLVVRCEIPDKNWSLLNIDSKKVVALRGAKEAAAIQVGKLMGVSVRTIQRKSKPASDTVSFVIKDAPSSKKDNSKYDQLLAVEILCNTFHLDRKNVTAKIEELFAT